MSLDNLPLIPDMTVQALILHVPNREPTRFPCCGLGLPSYVEQCLLSQVSLRCAFELSGSRLFLIHFQAVEAADGRTRPELHVPEDGLPFLYGCRPQALTLPLKTATPLS